MPTPAALTHKKCQSLRGLLLGDAFGVPFEFSDAQTLASLPRQAWSFPYKELDSFHRAHSSAPPCAWSDDGAMALALLDSLEACGTVDLVDLSQRFLRWKNYGHYAVDGKVFDVGNQVRMGLGRIEKGAHPSQSGPCLETDNGNGSLMRVLPLALWHKGSDEELVQLAHAQSLPTHGHRRAQVVCALYCLWARKLLDTPSDPNEAFDAAWDALESIYDQAHDDLSLQELGVVGDDEGRVPRGTGYVVDTLWSVKHSLCGTSSFENALTRAVQLGNDTDTTAALTGGLAAIVHPIPQAWCKALPSHPVLERLLGVLETPVTTSHMTSGRSGLRS